MSTKQRPSHEPIFSLVQSTNSSLAFKNATTSSLAVTVAILGILNVLPLGVANPRGRVCEHSTLHLHCEGGLNIQIVDALYGRKAGREICPHSSIQTTDCNATTSRSVVSSACDGENSCSVSASNNVFGDPCRGTYKYLDVEYKCVENPRGRVCEHSTLYLRCAHGQNIQIVNALYGRKAGREICPHSSIQTTNCKASSSERVVSSACNGRTQCSVRASNNVFGDPCRRTYKYLEVEYKCVANLRARVCEHHTLRLSCPPGQTLDIVDAVYGRKAGRGICTHDSIKTTTCRASSSLSVVQRACDRRNSCSVRASNSVFGDPCRGTYKYLEVGYQCHQ